MPRLAAAPQKRRPTAIPKAARTAARRPAFTAVAMTIAVSGPGSIVSSAAAIA